MSEFLLLHVNDDGGVVKFYKNIRKVVSLILALITRWDDYVHDCAVGIEVRTLKATTKGANKSFLQKVMRC